ncbi:MAG: sigma-54-dependent Fis family transcriptional regulator [Proteobacteria bacterium]|nr:sigma-54-dependent Fis family transcriptional regulator [Pseudomonadota bacterium]
MTTQTNEWEKLRQERDFYRKLLALGSQDDLGPLLDTALDLIVQVTDAEKGYLELRPQDENDEWPDDVAQPWFAKTACSDEDVAKIRRNISRGIISKAMLEGETIETVSALEDERFRDRKSVKAHQITAVLCAPVGHPSIGVVYLQGRIADAPREFTADDRARAELFARQLAPLAERLVGQYRRRLESDDTREIRKAFSCPGILGRSGRLAQVLHTASSVAPLEIDVLITGPSGTGKTAMARAIHQNSRRSNGPFVELNCAAIPETLFESDLFGAMPGAHSSATRRIPGKLEAADSGTLFLDEIGELSLGAQAKLLQLLQSRQYYPLGATKPKRANVRIVSATNADLRTLVNERRFREDLYYRLSVMPLEMPSLADRTDDIPILVEHFCQKTCERHQLEQFVVSRRALVACQEATWPGNVRELANRVEAAVIRARGQDSTTLEVYHLFPDEIANVQDQTQPRSFQEAMRDFQRRFVREALEGNDWNVAETARQLSIARSHLYNLIHAHKLTRLTE